jgi:hypothetical protein
MREGKFTFPCLVFAKRANRLDGSAKTLSPQKQMRKNSLVVVEIYAKKASTAEGKLPTNVIMVTG